MLKVSSINKAIIAVALVEVAVDVRIALRLPGTYLDTRQVWVVKVNHQEEITGISVVRGVVVLMNLNTISVLANPHFLHVVIGKADVDELVALETTFYVADIFLLAVARVFHHLVVEVFFVFCCLLGFFDDMAHNDDGIVIEDALDIVGTLQAALSRPKAIDSMSWSAPKVKVTSSTNERLLFLNANFIGTLRQMTRPLSW